MTCQKTVEVILIKSSVIRVRPLQSAVCPGCQSLGYCRADWLRLKNSQQTFEIPIIEPISLSVGDFITLEVNQQELVFQIVKLYSPLMLGLLGPIVLGQVLGWSETLQILAAFGGLTIASMFSHRGMQEFQIRIKE